MGRITPPRTQRMSRGRIPGLGVPCLVVRMRRKASFPTMRSRRGVPTWWGDQPVPASRSVGTGVEAAAHAV